MQMLRSYFETKAMQRRALDAYSKEFAGKRGRSDWATSVKLAPYEAAQALRFQPQSVMLAVV